jgi:NTP pyrophosphatase (non-canonical NTP hydrolase)
MAVSRFPFPPIGVPPGGDAGSVRSANVNLIELQDVIERTYGDRDRDRGVAPTVAWLAEELGELAQAVRKGTQADIEHEFSDVLAWVATLANQVGVDLTTVVDRYRNGCPKCEQLPCAC